LRQIICVFKRHLKLEGRPSEHNRTERKKK